MNNKRFEDRTTEHDNWENDLMDIIRPYTDRRHLPDRRVSFNGVPVSFDVKTNVFVEDSSHDEYFRLWDEGERVFIIYKNKSENNGNVYADWIVNLSWRGPLPASPKSTSGDDYYIISGGRELEQFLEDSKTNG